MADLQSFRQASSRCMGHPEHGWTIGVETTTGPLGQGVATSVGMAIAHAWLAATYNRPGFTLFDHRVFALAGDGDMMEGLSAEAASLAGHLKLGRLCWIYDSNHISTEGSTAITFTDDVGARFAACGWQVLQVADANEVVEAWRVVMALRDCPASLVLSRQALHTLDRGRYAGAEGLARGAYVLADAADGRPEVLLLASGSEVALCIAAYEELLREGIQARVVSMPSWDLFERQDEAYREQVLPEAVAEHVSVEAASPLGWDRYVGRHGAIIAMRSFGLSAPGSVVQAHFGFDVAHVLAAARQQRDRHGRGVPA